MKTHKCNKEGNHTDNPQREARLQHRASLVNIQIEITPARRHAGIEVTAIDLGDISHEDDAGDKGAEEEQIDEGDEQGIVACAEITNHREERPCQRQRRDYEEDEDIVRRELVNAHVLVHEPAEHADYRCCDYDFEDAPAEEEEAGYRHVAGRVVVIVVCEDG